MRVNRFDHVVLTKATGELISCYLRDPDGNLIEPSNYRAG